MHRCTYCPKTFADSKAKFKHMVKDHEEQYKADLSPTAWKRQKTKFG